MRPRRPPRLETIFDRYEPPLFFVTFCARDRSPRLATPQADAALRDYGARGLELGAAALGRYVIMPDHVHLFVQGGSEFVLGRWVKGLKAAMHRALQARRELWQPGFWDHLIRNGESYSLKWAYVRENPVRAGLVASPEDWPFQGEIVSLRPD